MLCVRVASLLAVLMVAGCLFGGTYGDPNKKQNNYKKSLTGKPGTQPRQRRLGNVHIVKLRVYAGHELRVQRVDWKARLRKLVAQTNPILERELRLRLVISFTQPWRRKASADDMSAMVAELEQLDPGGETEWVLGLVTPLAYTTPSLHQLGIARVNGRHMVMRSASVVARPGHRTQGRPEEIEVVTLLHEVGHILGELHARDERDFMFPEMRKTQKEYDRDRGVRMMWNLHHRVNKATNAADTAVATKRAEPKPPAPDKTGGVTALIDSADAVSDSGKALDILRTAAAQMVTLKLDNDDLWLRLATSFAGRQALSAAEGALGHMKSPRPEHATATWVITTRARAALPRTGAGMIPVANEPEYIVLVNELIGSVSAGDVTKTGRVMKRVAARFPRSAGLAVGRCYRAIYAKRERVARRHCKRALAIHPGSSWANYLLGFVERRRKHLGKAVTWMKKALVADPYLQPAWRDLAKMYIEQEDTDALNNHLRAYESTFGQPMRF